MISPDELTNDARELAGGFGASRRCNPRRGQVFLEVTAEHLGSERVHRTSRSRDGSNDLFATAFFDERPFDRFELTAHAPNASDELLLVLDRVHAG